MGDESGKGQGKRGRGKRGVVGGAGGRHRGKGP